MCGDHRNGIQLQTFPLSTHVEETTKKKNKTKTLPY